MVREDLVTRLSNRDPGVRLEAVQELGGLDDPDALACLVECLMDAEPSVRSAARAGMKRLTGLDFGYDRDPWLQWWKEKAGIRCNRCGKRLYAARLYYLAKVQLTSEPREIYLTEADLKPASPDELRRCAEELDSRNPDEVRDEVYVRLRYYLCTPCKLDFVKNVRGNGGTDEE